MDPTPFNNVVVHPKVENQNAAADWSYFDDYYTNLMPTWEQGSGFCESFIINNCGVSNILGDLDDYPLQRQKTNEESSYLKVEDFDKICGDLNVWDYEPSSAAAAIFQENIGAVTFSHLDEEGRSLSSGSNNNSNNNETMRRNSGKPAALEFNEIQKYFDVPITKAAKELKVGLTALKKRCRELNISRWPHRKIKSLTALIHNIKELGMGNEISMLEEHKRMVECIPEMELTERTKKLRQACFKANYKKRKALAPPSD